jgi:hypothetical protein
MRLIIFCLLLLSCGKDGKDGTNGKDGLNGLDAIEQIESVFISNGVSCITTGVQLPTMLPDLCFSYVNPALRIHPMVGGVCQTGTNLYSQNITTVASTPVFVPETGTSFSASVINDSTTVVFLSRNSGCGYVKAIKFRE